MVQKIVSSTAGRSFEFARGESEMQELWSARKQALWSVMSMRRGPEDHVWTTDVAVPISKLPEIIEATKQDMTESGLLAGMCGHVGDGNFHGRDFCFPIPPSQLDQSLTRGSDHPLQYRRESNSRGRGPSDGKAGC